MTTKPIDYKSDRPDVQVLYYDGKTLHQMGEVVESVSIKGDVAQAARECSVTFANTTKGIQRIFDIVNGKEIRVLSGEMEVFRGTVRSFERHSDGRDSLIAKDGNEYLIKNTVNVKFIEKTATHIIKTLCGNYGLAIGKLSDTKHKIPRFIMRGKTIYDVFITALTMTQKVTGKRYMLHNVKGKLTLEEVKPAKEWLRYEAGKNLISASYSESIDDTRTQVLYTGGDEKSPYKVVVKKDTDKYGIMQHVEHNSDANQSALPGLANALLAELSKPQKEMSIKVLGIRNMVAGMAVVVQDNLTGIRGTYFVLADNHEFSAGGVHVMDLTLSKTLDLPVLEYEPPNEETDSDSGSSAEYDVAYTKGWIATAYDPMLGGINTSGDPRTTATSTRWAYNRTIAVDPKVIPHGSVVAIKVPSMPKYNGMYLAEDSGGAIKGKRIDILIQGKNATSTFGRREIEVAILEKGKGAPDARAKVKTWNSIKKKWNTKKEQREVDKAAKGKAAGIIKTANSYKGKLRYVFGSKNLPNGTSDCSGFTSYVFNKHGIKLPHGTSAQIRLGKSVNKADAKPGDLVFFQNTYRKGVSHVGIVTRKGYCISMHDKGCTEHTYTTGYWGQHYMSIRRAL
ncbi:NlpC/P60 family protein [Sporosarcina sp. FSL K6-3508]|uniref:C40 family peptidase n=1 Tax=Sporosarcina sp. FSL K6-3508 TaxID=2921557 RepID=UPI003159C93A